MKVIKAAIASAFIIMGCMMTFPGLLPIIIGMMLLAKLILNRIEKI